MLQLKPLLAPQIQLETKSKQGDKKLSNLQFND
jgi:hypothetical protein